MEWNWFLLDKKKIPKFIFVDILHFLLLFFDYIIFFEMGFLPV
jgi:hypothetical protein